MTANVVLRKSTYDQSIATLRKQFEGDPYASGVAIQHFAKGLTVLADDDPYFSPETEARTERIKRIVEIAGVSRKEAERRINVADGTLPVEDMTIAEREEYLNTIGLPGQSDPDDLPDPRTTEEIFAAAQADVETEQAYREFIRIDPDRTARYQAVRQAEAGRERNIEEDIRTETRRNPHLAPAVIEGQVRTRTPVTPGLAEMQAEKAQRAEVLRSSFGVVPMEELQDTPELRAWLGLPPKAD